MRLGADAPSGACGESVGDVMTRSGELWAVTSYYNPTGSRLRRENYRIFRDRLSVPLVAVELSFTHSYDLDGEDAEVLIQLHARDLLWHKERLLNIGLDAIPSNCDMVAWLDCDVVLDRSDWPIAAENALTEFKVIQCFDEVWDQEASAPPAVSRSRSRLGISFMRALKEGADPRELLRHSLRRRLGICSGLAWAARREVLRDGLYDACIIGSGSRAIRCAQLGFTDEAFRYLDMGRGWRNHYQAWADKHFERVRGSLGSIDGKLTHLWHGSLNKRRYVERHHGLSRFGFDPTVDLELTERGVWRRLPLQPG